MWYVLIGVGILAFGLLAILSRRLLISAIWLALTSALVAVLIYLLGAPHIAVIELSVGAGLVTVLFVFAINIAGEDTQRLNPVIPKPVSIGAVILAIGLGLLLVIRSGGQFQALGITAEQSAILWQSRYIDLLIQVALIFSGVLGVIGLLAENLKPHQKEEGE